MKLRRIIVFVVTFVTVFAFSCGSVFAGYDFNKLPIVNGSTRTIGNLLTSKLDDAAYNFMLDFEKNRSDYVVIFSRGTYVSFLKIDPLADKTNFNQTYTNGFIRFAKKTSIQYVSFFISNGFPVITDLKGNSYSFTSTYLCKGTFDYNYDILTCLVTYDYFSKFFTITSNPYNFIWTYSYGANKQAIFTFDDDLSKFDPPTSSAPTSSEPTSSEPTSSTPTSSEPTSSEPTSSEPTSSEPTPSAPTSSTPTSSEPVSSKPTSSEPVSSKPTSSEPVSSKPTSSEPTKPPPIKEEYLGISPSVVTDIFSYFRSVAGASTNIGIMVFIFIVGIFITVSIFRYFFD